MSTFLELYTTVTDSIGRADTLGVSIAKRGVNYGAVLTALIVNPSELKAKGNLTATASSSSISKSSLTGIRYIESIYNTTSSCIVYPMLSDKFRLIVSSSETTVRFYYEHGETIYYNPPSVNNTLSVEYARYPAELTNDGDVLDFTKHDSLITSAATGYAFASLEESDSQSIWDKLIQTFMVPFSLNDKKVNELKEAMKLGGYSI